MSAAVAATRRAVRSRSRALITDNDRKILEQEGQQRLFVEVTNRRSVDEWAEIIRAHIGRSVEAVIAAGKHLVAARNDVDHGEWLPLLGRVGIGERTAQRLMFIANNLQLANPTRVSDLPAAWGTLYELTKLPHDVLEAKIADGTITPETTRKAAAELRSSGGEDPPDHDYEEHWQGMPAYRNNPPEQFGRVSVLFARKEDMELFAKLIEQPITDRTKAVWFPAKPKVSRKDFMWHGSTSRMDKTFHDAELDPEDPEAAEQVA
jgi:hypothetical protein